MVDLILSGIHFSKNILCFNVVMVKDISMLPLGMG